jgi:phosphoribosylformylglycinamidine (FGAM) synthase-like enzyme
LSGGGVPQVDATVAKATFAAIHSAITGGCVRACHDLSEGGLAVAVAEMAFAGGLGARVYLAQVPHRIDLTQFKERSGLVNSLLLFSESNSRFLCEVQPDMVLHFEKLMGNVPHAAIGEVITKRRLQVIDFHPDNPDHVIDLDLQTLKEAWQRPLRMD